MIEASLFSIINVGVGFCVAWVLAHYIIPFIFGGPRHKGKSLAVVLVFTVAALIRNFIVYWAFTV